MYDFTLNTPSKGLYNITDEVEKAVTLSGVTDGLAVVFCPHTTAGITINENSDINVGKDITLGLDKVFPRFSEFTHDEGNSDGHIKSSLVGASETVIIEKGKMILGRWQSIFFAEFDPPRNRHFYVKIIKAV